MAGDKRPDEIKPEIKLTERNKLILGTGQLLVKLFLPVLAAGGLSTGTYAALAHHSDQQKVSTSYEQLAGKFNQTLEQLDQMRLRQVEHNEDLLRLRLALRELDDRLHTVERHHVVAIKRNPVSPTTRPTKKLPSDMVLKPDTDRDGVVDEPPAALPRVAVDAVIDRPVTKAVPLPAFKTQRAPAKFDVAGQAPAK